MLSTAVKFKKIFGVSPSVGGLYTRGIFFGIILWLVGYLLLNDDVRDGGMFQFVFSLLGFSITLGLCLSVGVGLYFSCSGDGKASDSSN